MVSEPSAYQAFACLAEPVMAALKAFACQACSSFDRRNPGRSDPTAAAVWQLAPGSAGFFLSGRRHPKRYEKGAQRLPASMDLPGRRPSEAVSGPSRNLPRGPMRAAVRSIESLLVLSLSSQSTPGAECFVRFS